MEFVGRLGGGGFKKIFLPTTIRICANIIFIVYESILQKT